MANSVKKYMVANDMLRIANMYNHILYKKHYYKHGLYTEQEINHFFGDFDKACRELKIINPDDPYDINVVLEDIRFVYRDQKKISSNIYRNYGIYSVKALEQRYSSFDDLAVQAGCYKRRKRKAENNFASPRLYPVYPIKSSGKHVMLKWNRG